MFMKPPATPTSSVGIGTAFYDEHAATLFTGYRALAPETVHSGWCDLLGTESQRVLDVGAGSGRDADWLCQMGHSVTAVEPADQLRELATANTSSAVRWVNDRLPLLAKVAAEAQSFDFILVSAVWMHLSPPEQRMALETLSRLLAPAGRLVVSLRHTAFDDMLSFHPCAAADLGALAAEFGLAIQRTTLSTDVGGREVDWTTVILA
jgi:2-polyprenyl-3-methyl-5-hydroxy-6-metoxy-1,4-benzoquinol methylase